MMSDAEMFTSRTALLLGEDVMHRLAETKVIVFGVGGVGSWCAECLVRSGIRQLTIVDYDLICMSNCNRQLMATRKTIGMAKVDVLKQRLLDISPDADIRAMRMTYSAENAHEFHLEHYDYVIDAIDSLKDKANLILHATSVTSLVTLWLGHCVSDSNITKLILHVNSSVFIVRNCRWKIKEIYLQVRTVSG